MNDCEALTHLKIPEAGSSQAGIGYIRLAELQPAICFTLVL